MSQTLYKECELRQFRPARDADVTGASNVGRAKRWLPEDEAVIGRRVRIAERGEWEIISAPDPALPGCIVRRLDPSALNVECKA